MPYFCNILSLKAASCTLSSDLKTNTWSST